MSRATDLRQTAAVYKRLAEFRTSGGHGTDSLLLSLAAELDREAAELEAQLLHRAPRSASNPSSSNTDRGVF